jgi:hypothetical protein
MDSSSFSFLEPWRALPPERAEALLRELQIELSPGHPLHGIQLAGIAVSRHADDVLFRLQDGRVAQVHLTWRRGVEKNPWPSHRIYASFEEWAQQVMVPDREWE